MPEAREGRSRRGDPRQARATPSRRAHRVPRPRRPRAGRAARRAPARGHRVQGLQEHAGPPGGARRPGSTTCSPCSRGRSPSPSSTATPSPRPRRCATSRRDEPQLVVKGGLLGPRVLTAADVDRPWPTSSPARCCWPGSPAASRRRSPRRPACSRRFTRNIAYGIKALIDQRSPPARRRRPTRRARGRGRAEAATAAEARRGRRRRGRARTAPLAEARPRAPRRRGVRRPRRPRRRARGAGRGRADPDRPGRRPARRPPPIRTNQENHRWQHHVHRRAAGRLQEHDRPRAQRVPEGVRGGVRRDRRRPGGRGRARRRRRRRGGRGRPRSRTSSTSSSPAPATRRSRSSRRSGPSRASGSRRPRTSSTAPRKPVLEKVSKEDAEKAKAQLEEAPAPTSSSSSAAGDPGAADPGSRRARPPTVGGPARSPLTRGAVVRIFASEHDPARRAVLSCTLATGVGPLGSPSPCPPAGALAIVWYRARRAPYRCQPCGPVPAPATMLAPGGPAGPSL